MDHESFEVLGKWELDRGPQQLAYDVWWHLGTTPSSPASGEHPTWCRRASIREICSRADTATNTCLGHDQAASCAGKLDLGAEQQMVLELRPAHDPTRAYGFAGVVCR